jgi:hypothetical protein
LSFLSSFDMAYRTKTPFNGVDNHQHQPANTTSTSLFIPVRRNMCLGFVNDASEGYPG